MSDFRDVKLLIEKLVADYKQLFSEEYQAFLSGQKIKVQARANKFSEFKGTDILERKLGEYPATLFTILQMKLPPDSFAFLDSIEGAHWFFNRFPEFRETEKI